MYFMYYTSTLLPIFYPCLLAAFQLQAYLQAKWKTADLNLHCLRKRINTSKEGQGLRVHRVLHWVFTLCKSVLRCYFITNMDSLFNDSLKTQSIPKHIIIEET